MQIKDNIINYLSDILNTDTIIFRVCFLLFLTFTISSCSFIKLKKDLEQMNKYAVIRGKITLPSGDNSNSPCIIAAFDKKNKLVKYALIQHNSNYFVMQLPEHGVYKISIFQDKNRNSTYQISEPSDLWLNPMNVKLKKKDPIIVDFTLSPKKILPETLRIATADSKLFSGNTFKIITGEKTDFSLFQFSNKYGSLGLWQPFEAFRKYGVGVYFIEDYDPKKIPLLCIYGMGGFAQDWQTFFNSIDKSKFQPWFYFYPSGYSISSSGKALNIIMENIRKKYHYKKLYIVSHSMGGLVAHKFITLNRQQNKKNFVKLFITVSTPWAGDKDAEWGQKAPVTIPCWNDIVPSSAFIKNTKASDLDGIPYYMLFTYKGDRKPFRINNDTTISIASQLKMEFQLKAEKVYGFNDHHAAILHDITAIDIINSILKKYSE
jgi:pimeloyl-ACP methyl ester carboxylesterase